MTDIGDVVLVYLENSPAFFARIEDISPDIKAGWYHVKLLVLQVPLMTITWILKAEYINGEEFTMGGRPVRLEKVVCPESSLPSPEDKTMEDKAGETAENGEKKEGKGKVISIFERKKEKKED
ncbi:MAG TPA: hypothetical protein ENG51_18790 [Deltaproteobacteria bacterium]|nr:MAG: hypothetical protein DRG83_01385 [Deltaproteobacteria bacterium]HDM78486.1 hypothetical protein [Deltaproteobacteria bacterium]